MVSVQQFGFWVKGGVIMWYVLVNSRWRKARRYDYNTVMPYCQNVLHSIDSDMVKFKPI